MSMINRNNYEQYFLDYLEGKLEDRYVKELYVFLNFNPDLKDELENFENITINAERFSYLNKNELKKNSTLIITDENFNDTCISFYENDIEQNEKTDLLNFIQKHQDKKDVFELYKKVYLKPDLSIQFYNKNKLKHFRILTERSLFLRIAAIAASVAVILVIYILINRGSNNNIAINNIDVNKQINVSSDKTDMSQEFKPDRIKMSLKQNSIQKIPQLSDEQERPSFNEINLIVPKEFNQLELNLTPSLITQIKSNSNVVINSEQSENKEQYLTIPEYATFRFKEDILKQKSQDSKHISLWDLVSAGIDKIESISNVKIDIERDKEQGKIKALALNSRNFELSRSFN